MTVVKMNDMVATVLGVVFLAFLQSELSYAGTQNGMNGIKYIIYILQIQKKLISLKTENHLKG